MKQSPELIYWRRHQTFAVIASISAALLGGAALAGWFLHNDALKSIIPGSSPLKPNIASGFLLCGAALALLSRPRVAKPIRICAATVAAGVISLGALTLAEYFLNWNLGIDQWLVRDFPATMGNVHPGRMMPTTAFCFLLLGSAIFTEAQVISTRLRLPLMAGASAALVIIGVLALGGFLLEKFLGPQWNLLGMNISGISAAVGFMILGSGLLTLAQSEGELIWSLDAPTTTGFAIGILLTFLTTASAFTFAKHMLETNNWVTHRQDVLKQVQHCMTGAAELAGSERIYAILGDEALLKGREQTIAAVKQDLRDVRKLTADNPSQQRRLDGLEPLIGQRIDWEEKVITVRRQQGATAAAQMILAGPGLGLSNEIAGMFKEMEDEEYGLLSTNRKRAEEASVATFLVLPLGVFLSLAVLSLGVFFLNAGVGERAKAVTALRQSEEGMRAILESALDCVITMDHQGRVVEFNPAAEKTFGYRRDEAIGQLLSDLIIPPSLRERHQKGLSRYLATGEAPVLGKRLELSAVRRDSSEFPVELAITRIGSQMPPMFTGFIRDITERKRSEDALRQAEEKYRSIFENAVEGVFQTSPEGNYISVNPALARMFGYESPNELTQSVNDIGHKVYVSPERRLEFKRLIEADGLVEGFEYEVFRKDGSRIWLSENARTVRDAKETVLYYEGTAEDITKRKQAEDALRVSEAHLQTVVENLDEGVIVSDLKGGLLHWNRTALDIHGYTDLEEGLRSLTDFVDTFELAAMDGTQIPVEQWPLARVLRGENLHDLELRVRNIKANWERILNYGGTLVHDVNRQPLMAIVTVRDITERKRAEERLHEQADIINRAQDAIIIRDFNDQRVTFWNSGAERLYGWSAEEAIGQSIGELMYADPKDREGPLQTLLSAGEFRGELKQVTKDGREVIVDGRATIVRNPDGTPRSVLSINTDITGQKKLETQLLRAQRLESIGTLASGVAHDLNNILTPILICAETLRAGLGEEDRQSALLLIEESARRGAGVVKQVLTFARGIEGERVTINPRHLIEEMIDIARKTFPKSIEIGGRFLEDVRSIEGDPTQLHQVLLNLCVNARDAMPNGGSLTLAAENVDVDENYASMMPGAEIGPYVMLRVSDTGAGMPRATIDKIFDPFFTTKEIGKGTGLGLSTALGIVKSHGGLISVYSEIGAGTTFKLFLPAKVSEDTSPKAEGISELLSGHGELVLVVDDEPNILGVTKMVLEKHNYDILDAHDGPEALAIIAQQRDAIKVVLTDISMPYMDGVALIRTIKRMKPDARFIASTGQGEETRVAELESLGVTNFLTKPYDTGRLLETLDHALREKTDTLS
jgi:PAS domain S-box-containing protein